MRRIPNQNRANQRATAKAAAILTAIILVVPSQLFAIHINVPAAQRALQQAQAQASSRTQRQIPQRQILVSLPDKQLVLLENGNILKSYQVAVGADVSRSPEGDFTLINRLENPTYFAPGKVIGPGKDNPLGTRWMGLSKKGYGIHGTNVPSSIGKAASHGCIRMRQHDLEELFTLVSVGDKVMFRDAQMTALLAPITTQPTDVLVAVNGSVTVSATPVVTTADTTDQF